MRCTPAIAISMLCLIVEMGGTQAAAESPPEGGAAWTFRDGDRVALIGGTFIEREQRYGYVETALILANPDKTITFRNLGWSGDTIDGVSRSGFDPPEAGFKQLVDQVLAVKPTVIVVGYGANESFNGKAGLDAFTQGLERLIDALQPTKARFVLLAPLKQEDMGRPLPDPAKHNQDVALYSKAIEGIAKSRGAELVDIDPFSKQGPSNVSARLTDNGVHLTPLGYWKLVKDLESQIRQVHRNANIGDSRNNVLGSAGIVKVSLEMTAFPTLTARFEMTPETIRLTVQESQLPVPPRPDGRSDADKAARGSRPLIKVTGLAAGRYTLRVDGKALTTETDTQWVKGIGVDGGPEIDQVEQLRKAIIRKNELFFYRWRPQNITYLLGFRKHEQGNNAVELAQFDPLIAEQEQKIAVLKKPVPHVYELTRDDAKGGAR